MPISPPPSTTPLLDMARSVFMLEHSRLEFVTTMEKRLKSLDEMIKERSRSFDVALYVTAPGKLQQALDHVAVASNVPPALFGNDALDKQLKLACEQTLKRVVNSPDRIRGVAHTVVRLAGSMQGFFSEEFSLHLITNSTIYSRGRLLEVLFSLTVTHPDLSGAIAVQEQLVALLGHLAQHRAARQAILSKPGDATARLRGYLT